MSSKAQGLSLNAIIIAVIVLVVLVIILGITTGYFGKWVPRFYSVSSTSCAASGGIVADDCSADRLKEATGYYDDVPDGKKCCWKICSDQGGSCKDICDASKRLPSGDWGCFSDRPQCCKS